MYTAAQAGLYFGFYHGYSKLLRHHAPDIHVNRSSKNQDL